MHPHSNAKNRNGHWPLLLTCVEQLQPTRVRNIWRGAAVDGEKPKGMGAGHMLPPWLAAQCCSCSLPNKLSLRKLQASLLDSSQLQGCPAAPTPSMPVTFTQGGRSAVIGESDQVAAKDETAFLDKPPPSVLWCVSPLIFATFLGLQFVSWFL